MNTKTQNKLIRALGLGSIIIYGVGDILGAGIYAIVGKIAGHAGPLAWLSFAIAMTIVFFTALTYSELGSRFPKSGGVSIYVHEAFGRHFLSIFAGILLFSATILSMSTLSQAFVGYVRAFGISFPNWLGVVGFFTILLLINLRGITHSSITNIICTSVEVSGLLIVLGCGALYLFTPEHSIITTASDQMPSLSDLFKGAALAFFAFTGFEDLANVAEEVKQPEKNLPRAILSALGTAGLLYIAVSWMATAIIPGNELSQSGAPLFDVVKKSYPAMPSYIFLIIAIFAVSNTTLLNYITASRLLYGMSKNKLLPKFLQGVHSSYYTPYVAILIIFPFVVGLGIAGTLEGLASSTSAIVLTVFTFSSIALIKIKFSEKREKPSSNIFQVPYFIPYLAVAFNITAISFLPLQNILYALALMGAGLLASIVLAGVASLPPSG